MTPLLPLDFWRAEIGYNPWHFWGLADDTVHPVTSKCNDIVHEYAWQGTDELGRAEIREKIEDAEKLCFDNLQYWPAPRYSEVTLPWPRFHDLRLMRLGRWDATGRWIPVMLDEGYVQAVGIETHTLISAAGAVTLTDEDGDGIKETFAVTVPTSVTDPGEIAVYVPQADRLAGEKALSARWRIEPVQVSISAGSATITGKVWLLVKPVLYENEGNYPLNPNTAANFLTTLEVYRRYTETNGITSLTSQAALIWETRPCAWGCSNTATSGSTDPASEGWVAARCGIRDAEHGILVPAEAVYDAASGTWAHPGACFASCSEPDRVQIRFLAGMPLDSQHVMYKPFRTLVSRLAAAEMTRRICACDAANRELSHWQFDVSRVSGPETYQMNLDVLQNPLGTRRGHIYAWAQFKSLARVIGTLV